MPFSAMGSICIDMPLEQMVATQVLPTCICGYPLRARGLPSASLASRQ
jgi:hypothetical protein